jgi:hypothetical protein
MNSPLTYAFVTPEPVTEAPVPAPIAPEVIGSAAKATNGNSGGLSTPSILAMSVGGALLIVGAAALHRRRLNGAGDISAMDSTSVNPTGPDAA